MSASRETIDELIARQRSGYSLDQRFYTDPDIYNLELERIIFKTWILAGHVSQYREAGDFTTLNVDRESAIIVRGTDGELKAFANVCRHRGSLVCLEAEGHADKFQCPYHGWMYDVDGNLTAARDMPADFDASTHGLKPVSVAEMHGLVFASFSANPPSLDRAIEGMADVMRMYDFQNMKVAAKKSYPIPANWKLSVENYQECYHCATAHPEYARMHTLMLEDSKKQRASQHMYDRMEACGIQKFEIDYGESIAQPGEFSFGYWRTALFKKYKTGSRDGDAIAPLLGSIKGYDGGQGDLWFGPLSFVLAYNDHIVCYVFTPTGHESSNCDVYWLVRGDAEVGKDYDVDELTWLWDVTTAADKEIIVNNSKGLHSRFYEPGPFSKMEQPEMIYLDWLIRELQQT